MHAHQFWWAWLFQFQRYGYLSKTAKFSFRGMDCPWSSKNLINRNRLKKFIQVGIDVKFMHTDFGGRGLSGFGDKFSLWSIKGKNLIDQNWLTKFMQVGVHGKKEKFGQI